NLLLLRKQQSCEFVQVTLTVGHTILNVSNSCPSMCKCTSEETILCNRAGLKTLPGEIAPSTISLNLSNNYLRILNTNTFRNLTFLHSLWLDGNNLTFLTPGTFHALSRLQELHLSRNSRLTYLHANTFRGLLNLISLDLSHCNIFEIHPLLFSHLPSLERLDLASNNMRYVPQAFRNLSSLTRLSLEGNHIEAIGRDSLKDLETLNDLNLRKNRIWIIQNGAFSKLLRLGMLNLGHNFITDLPNQLFEGLIQLKTMHLEANRITAVDCTFRQLLNLRNLYLNNNQISSISDSMATEDRCRVAGTTQGDAFPFCNCQITHFSPFNLVPDAKEATKYRCTWPLPKSKNFDLNHTTPPASAINHQNSFSGMAVTLLTVYRSILSENMQFPVGSFVNILLL
uniref:Uncharacterized protein n=1 Tax=Junco hyemalis TaxID=40217 RepID=A0A8C5JH52_JUNHY